MPRSTRRVNPVACLRETVEDVPSLPAVDDAAAILDGGHLWLLELVEGLPVRFSVAESGLCTFGDAERVFDEVPLAYRAAARHVREHLDRDALRAAAADLPGFTFVGVATVHRRVDYDWDRLPPFVGTEIHSSSREGFLPPDAVERAYAGIDLSPVNALRKEVRAADFHPGSYAFPDSAWYDGPVAGVMLRNKTGNRAKLVNHSLTAPRDGIDLDRDPATLGRDWTTAARVERVVEDLADRGRPADPEEIGERVLERLYREEYRTIANAARPVDTDAFRSAVGERVRSVLADRG